MTKQELCYAFGFYYVTVNQMANFEETWEFRAELRGNVAVTPR